MSKSKEERKVINVAMDIDTHRKIKHIVAENDMTVKSYVELMLKEKVQSDFKQFLNQWEDNE
jgi:dephospho-CoA kinase